MKRFNRVLIGFSILVLSACATTITMPTAQRIPFPVNEYAALQTEGTGTVNIQAFMKTVGGDVKTAAGNNVILTPVTSYTIDWHNKSAQGFNVGSPDPRINQYQYEKTADASGRAVFTNVPPGEYYAISTVTWGVPSGYYRIERQGGAVCRRIKVKNGETVEVIATSWE